MEQEYRDLILKIQRHRKELKRNLNLTDAFYDELVKNGVISAQESEKVKTGQDRVTKLLDVVLKKDGVAQLNGFISAMEHSGQTDIASKIRNQRVNAAGPVDPIKKGKVSAMQNQLTRWHVNTLLEHLCLLFQ